jgi:2-oxoglutarate ferredoxin oxidoreductase subunit gamma
MASGKVEIKIGGFGGQGVILAGIIIGRAATIYDGKFATLTQSFGPEARGSACSAKLIISKEQILYPYVRTPHILIAMSQDAYNIFEPELDKNGILIIENDLVKPKPDRNIKVFDIPATRFAEEIGRRMVLNIVMVGFFTAVTGLVTEDGARKAVLDLVPKGTEELNLKAFNKGFEYGRSRI